MDIHKNADIAILKNQEKCVKSHILYWIYFSVQKCVLK